MASPRSIKAGDAFVTLSLRNRMTRGLKAAERRLRMFGQGLRTAGTRLAGLGAGVLAPLAAATKLFASTGDQLDKMSKRTGIAVESLSELGFAAEQSGSSLEEAANAILRMNRRIGRIRAGEGTATQVEAMQALGLEAEQLSQMSPEQTFLAIADAMAAMEDPTQAAGLAQRAFGTEVDRILPLLLQGRDGIEQLRQQARDLGLTMTGDAAESAADLTDAMNITWRVLRRTAEVVGQALAPAILNLLERVNAVVVPVQQWIKDNSALAVSIAKWAAIIGIAGVALIGLSAVVSILASGLGVLGSAIGLVLAAIGALITPLGLATAGIVMITTAIAGMTGAGSMAVDFLIDKFGQLLDFSRDVFSGIADAIMSGDLKLAAEIAWAGLRVVWQQGVSALRTAWARFTQWFGSMAIEAFFGAAKIASDAVAGIQRGWLRLKSFLRGFWSDTKNAAVETWNLVALQAKKAAIRAAAGFDDNIDVDAAIQEAERQFVERQKNAQQQLQQERQQVEKDRAKALADIDEAQQQRAATIGEALEQTLANLSTGSDAAIEAAKKDLERAQAALKQLRDQARQQREESGAGEGPDAPDFQGIIDQIQVGMQGAAREIEARGTFSARALQSLQGGSDNEAKRTADATEQTAQETKRSRRELERLTGAFRVA